MYLPVPGISGRGAMTKREFPGYQPCQTPQARSGYILVQNRRPAQPVDARRGLPATATTAVPLTCMTHQK